MLLTRGCAMTSLIRRLFCAYILVLVAVGLNAGPAGSEEINGNGAAVRLAMMTAPAPLNTLAPALAEPAALLCGKVWVDTKYVLSNNCLKACLNSGHKMGDCVSSLVPLCKTCWAHLVACSTSSAIPPADRCKACTLHYAGCMKAFF